MNILLLWIIHDLESELYFNHPRYTQHSFEGDAGGYDTRFDKAADKGRGAKWNRDANSPPTPKPRSEPPFADSQRSRSPRESASPGATSGGGRGASADGGAQGGNIWYQPPVPSRPSSTGPPEKDDWNFDDLQFDDEDFADELFKDRGEFAGGAASRGGARPRGGEAKAAPSGPRGGKASSTSAGFAGEDDGFGFNDELSLGGGSFSKQDFKEPFDLDDLGFDDDDLFGGELGAAAWDDEDDLLMLDDLEDDMGGPGRGRKGGMAGGATMPGGSGDLPSRGISSSGSGGPSRQRWEGGGQGAGERRGYGDRQPQGQSNRGGQRGGFDRDDAFGDDSFGGFEEPSRGRNDRGADRPQRGGDTGRGQGRGGAPTKELDWGGDLMDDGLLDDDMGGYIKPGRGGRGGGFDFDDLDSFAPDGGDDPFGGGGGGGGYQQRGGGGGGGGGYQQREGGRLGGGRGGGGRNYGRGDGGRGYNQGRGGRGGGFGADRDGGYGGEQGRGGRGYGGGGRGDGGYRGGRGAGGRFSSGGRDGERSGGQGNY